MKVLLLYQKQLTVYHINIALIIMDLLKETWNILDRKMNISLHMTLIMTMNILIHLMHMMEILMPVGTLIKYNTHILIS